MTTDRKFQAMITKAARLADQAREAMDAVNRECKARYGGHGYSDVDADHIVECIDYGGGMTLQDFHESMMSALCSKGLLNEDGSIKPAED